MIFTIGTSDRDSEAFFAELVSRDVQLLVDVRSSPHSRNRWANRDRIEVAAVRHGIRYAWSGALLGGRNPIATTNRDFAVAAEAVLELADDGPVAIFCSEGDPTQCHRSYKVGAHLLVRHGFVAMNILRDGREEDIVRSLFRTPPSRVPPCVRAGLARLRIGPLESRAYRQALD